MTTQPFRKRFRALVAIGPSFTGCMQLPGSFAKQLFQVALGFILGSLFERNYFSFLHWCILSLFGFRCRLALPSTFNYPVAQARPFYSQLDDNRQVLGAAPSWRTIFG